MSVRLLALDIDGTLAARGDEVSVRTRGALHRAADAGIEIVIATGRRYRTTRRVIASLGLDVRAVCLGGALVKERDGTTLQARPLSPEQFRGVTRALQASGQSAIVQRDSSDGGADFLMDGARSWNGPTSRYMASNQDFAEWRADLATEARPDALVVGAYGPEEELLQAGRAAQAAFPGELFTVVTPLPASSENRGSYYLEIASSAVCKWQGLEALAGHLAIQTRAICAIGDQLNDLTMVRSAGLGIAMGNGHPDLKAAAQIVIGRHDEDGIADWVESHLEGR